MEKILNIENLSVLSKETITPAISIYMPLKISGKARSENKIRLDNLIKKTIKKLVSAGTEKEYAAQIMAPAEKLRDNGLFWRQTPAAGLALFATPPQIFRYFELPDRVKESVRVSSGFHLDPLREVMRNNPDFYLLVLSKTNLAFYRAGGGKLLKLPIRGLPEKIKELLPGRDPEKTLQSHGRSPLGKSEIFHGHGKGKDTKKLLFLKYFQIVDKSISRILAQKKEQLVFAGDSGIFSIYRQANTYPYFFKKNIGGNLTDENLENVRKKAVKLLKSTS